MLKKKSDKSNGNGKDQPESIDGVAEDGNLLHSIWLISLLAILLPMLASFVSLVIVRDAGMRDEQLLMASRGHAMQQAANIDSLLSDYRARLQAAARSPAALSAIASGKREELLLVEEDMLNYFPNLTSLHLVAMGELGTAALEAGDLGLRNHIELDMLRRASEKGQTIPESYSVDNAWLTSFAQSVQNPSQPEQKAVILATLDNSVLSKKLGGTSAELGKASLMQVFRSGNVTRSTAIASGGAGAAEAYQATADLNESTWQIVFTPSARMLSLHRVSSNVVFIMLGAMTVLVIAVMAGLLFAFQRGLAAQAQQIIAGTERKATIKVRLPALVPLARELRKSSQAERPAPVSQPQEPAEAPAAEPEPAAAPEEAEETVEDAPPPPVPAHIFRAYDIRGIVDTEISEGFATLLGKALGTLLEKQGQQALIVGCDGRTTSPALKSALVKGLLESGRDVIDIGLVPTPVLYFATHNLSTKSGVMVTASHNPAEFNGFKITVGGKPLAGDALQALCTLMQEGGFSSGSGRLAKQDVRSDYVDAIVGDVAITNPLKIVVDAGNGAAGDVAPRVLEGLGCEVVRLYCDIDGTFPNHHPDPGVDANLNDLVTVVTREGADFGVAYDGDGDRLTVVTGNGDIVRNDTLLMIFAQDVVSRNPGADVIFDVKCSQHLTQLVSGHGGRPVLWKTGHAFMRQKVMETGALLGGEFSGHLYFGERWFGFDDATYATARLAEIISGTGIDLPSLLAEYPRTQNTPEILIPVSDAQKFDIMHRLTEIGDFSPGKVTTLDGVRVDYNDGWGLVRASNTNPALTARFEAKDADSLERLKQQFRDQLMRVAPELDLGF